MPVQVRFRALTSKLPLIKTEGMIQEVTAVTEAFVEEEVIRVAKTYPPERPNQVYRRTYRLRESWRLRTNYGVSGLTVRAVSEGVRYTPLVQGVKQLPIHTDTGWPIIPRLKINRNKLHNGLRNIYRRRAI